MLSVFYAECLSVTNQTFMLSVVMMSVGMLNVMAPFNEIGSDVACKY
jgi:hypothetical protein